MHTAVVATIKFNCLSSGSQAAYCHVPTPRVAWCSSKKTSKPSVKANKKQKYSPSSCSAGSVVENESVDEVHQICNSSFYFHCFTHLVQLTSSLKYP